MEDFGTILYKVVQSNVSSNTLSTINIYKVVQNIGIIYTKLPKTMFNQINTILYKVVQNFGTILYKVAHSNVSSNKYNIIQFVQNNV